MLLACRLKITFTFRLKLIISFLVQLQHLLLPSLVVTSSQVRVGTPLPLWSCCISDLGPEGPRHNRTIPVWSPGNLLRVTLASRGNSASENLQQETQQPKCCLYKTPCVAAPIRETSDIIARTLPYAWLPTDAPTRTRISFWFTSNVFLKETCLVKLMAPTSLFYVEATCKSSNEKGLLYAPENPEEHKKGMLSDQPQLLHITSTALLSHWGRQ